MASTGASAAASESSAATAAAAQQQTSGANESTPLVQQRLTLTQVVFGQGSAAAAAGSTTSGGGGEKLGDGGFVEVSTIEGQAGDMEVVAGLETSESRGSIFKESVEMHIAKENPGLMQWLTSLNGMALQAILCVSLVIIQTESSVWMEIARKYKPGGAGAEYKTFNSAALGVGVSIASVILCVVVAAASNELHLLFNSGTMSKLLKYAAPGCGFQVTGWLNLMALGFLSADVAKILDQGRLLVTAMITFQVFGRNQSIAGWNTLVVVSLSAISYAEMKKSLSNLAGSRKETSLLLQLLQDPSLTTTTGAPGSSPNDDNSYMLGMMIVLFSVVAQSALCVLCEKVMKDDKDMSFYVNKFYLEIPGVIMGLFLTNIGNPLLYRLLRDEMNAGSNILDKVGGEGDLWEYFREPFQGWNPIVLWAFVLLMLKSWLAGLMVKQLNAIVKQLCSVFGVGVTYFTMKVHICGTSTYFCPSNLSTVQFPMVVIDLCVLVAVLAYTLAGRDKQRKLMFKKELQHAREAQEIAQARV